LECRAVVPIWTSTNLTVKRPVSITARGVQKRKLDAWD
jgi:hypothetical protein